MSLPRALGIVLVVAIVGGCRQSTPPELKLPDPRVEFMTPVSGQITDVAEFPGLTDARITVSVRSRVAGYMTKVYFKDGSKVEENDVLFEIDPRPYRAELERAQGNLEQIEAHKRRLEHEYERAKKLYATRSISVEEFERYEGDYRETEANLQVARANRDLAKLDLEWTEIRAPASGLLSRRLVDPGNLIKADETVLTTIVTQDPMYVYFDVDEQNTLRVRRLIREGHVKAKSEKEVPVMVGLSDEAPNFPHEGIVDFTDNRVDVNTGSLRFRAIVSNPKGVLTPGLFARIRLPIGDPHPTLFVKEEAIASDQGRKIVYVVESKAPAGQAKPKSGSAEPSAPAKSDSAATAPRPGELAGRISTREIKIGTLRNGYRAIEGGLKPGDRVVVNGLQRIRTGIDVIATEMKDVPAAPTDVSFQEHGQDEAVGGVSKGAARSSSP